VVNVFCRIFANCRSSEAAQTVAGRHFASSWAMDGPESVASGLDALSGSSVFWFRTCAMICVGLSDVVFSMPLDTETMGVWCGTCFANFVQIVLINCVGTADRMMFALLNIL